MLATMPKIAASQSDRRVPQKIADEEPTPLYSKIPAIRLFTDGSTRRSASARRQALLQIS